MIALQVVHVIYGGHDCLDVTQLPQEDLCVSLPLTRARCCHCVGTQLLWPTRPIRTRIDTRQYPIDCLIKIIDAVRSDHLWRNERAEPCQSNAISKLLLKCQRFWKINTDAPPYPPSSHIISLYGYKMSRPGSKYRVV